MKNTTKSTTILAGLILLASAAFAQPAHNVEVLTADAGIQLSGTVARRVAITVEGIGLWNNLDLTIDVDGDAVAKVTEFSNVRQGYFVRLASANNGALVGTNGGESLAYSLTYAGAPVNFATPITESNVKTDRLGLEKILAITYAASEANLVSDLYTDDLTFTISVE